MKELRTSHVGLKFNCRVPEFKSDRRDHMLRHLINTCFNTGANNLTILLNRVYNAKRITLKMVKALKKKGRHVNLSEEKKVMILIRANGQGSNANNF